MASYKDRHAHLSEATTEQLLSEVVRRRIEALANCSDQEIEAELADRGVERPIDCPPRLVEK